MPSLKLSNPFRRGADRPSLKQRAAALKATAGRVMKRPAIRRSDALNIDLARNVVRYFGDDPINPALDADRALREAAHAVLRAAGDTSVPPGLERKKVDWHRPPEGFMAYPAIDPQGFINIDDGLGLEVERLHGIALAEFERRRESYRGGYAGRTEADWSAHLRRELRLDELAAAMSHGRAEQASAPKALDADLLALEAEFIAAHRAVLEVSEAHDTAYEQYDEPAMPTELRVWRNDWIYNSIPRPSMTSFGDGTARQWPYGAREVEILRSHPCTCVVVGGTEGTPVSGGGRMKSDAVAQERADAIVAAWDRWQAEIGARREALNLPALYAQVEATEVHRKSLLERLLSMPAHSLAGIGVKARVALALNMGASLSEAGASRYDPDEYEAFVFNLTGDVLALAGDASASHGKSATMTPAAAPTAPEYDLSACTLPQLARLYENWESVFLHLTGATAAPCFASEARGDFNSAGEVLEREYDRAGHILGFIADEAAKRVPAKESERDDRLCVLVRHEMNTNGRPTDRTLLAELNAAAGA